MSNTGWQSLISLDEMLLKQVMKQSHDKATTTSFQASLQASFQVGSQARLTHTKQ